MKFREGDTVKIKESRIHEVMSEKYRMSSLLRRHHPNRFTVSKARHKEISLAEVSDIAIFYPDEWFEHFVDLEWKTADSVSKLKELAYEIRDRMCSQNQR